MQRYFVQPDQINKDQVLFLGDDVHHITKVMRFVSGDQVLVCNGEGISWLVQFDSISAKEVRGTIIQALEENQELAVQITLAQGLAKGEKMDLIVQKTTELGVSQFQAFHSSRTIVKLDEKKEVNRIQRWAKIAKEAAEQSHRQKIPVIKEVITFQQLVTKAQEYDLALIAYEQEMGIGLHHYLRQIQKGHKIMIIIGPEGGFSVQEIQLAQEHGIHSVSLGKRILRTETAGLVALSYIGYQVEQIGLGNE